MPRPRRRPDPRFGLDPFSVPSALSDGATRHELRAGWNVPFTGVRIAPSTSADLLTRCRALATVLDDGVMFSHITALRLLGVDVPWTMADDERLHVTTQTAEDRPQRPGVVGHWTRQSFLEAAELGGLLVTTPRQTWTHLAVDLLPDETVVLGDAFMRRDLQLTTPAALRDIAFRTKKVKGIVLAREQIPRMRAGTDSVMETRTRLLIVGAGLPIPEVNEDVLDAQGHFIARVDLLYRRWKIAIEYDGDLHRTDRRTWQNDIRKRRALHALGWIVIVVVKADHDSPAPFLDELRAAIRSRR
ncbi:hypothetical protein ACFS27_18965 [Promicromonospora vindobonensis]|uniref:DUF559 domain-containing protein n=1 Tax=Promicromonospora vindobonensis TaxID=195748 RepID=A0ABW5VWS6_9MICO